MAKRKPKHRAEVAHISDRLRIYIFFLKNRWYFFVKPDLKRKVNALLTKVKP